MRKVLVALLLLVSASAFAGVAKNKSVRKPASVVDGGRVDVNRVKRALSNNGNAGWNAVAAGSRIQRSNIRVNQLRCSRESVYNDLDESNSQHILCVAPTNLRRDFVTDCAEWNEYGEDECLREITSSLPAFIYFEVSPQFRLEGDSKLEREGAGTCEGYNLGCSHAA